MHGEDVRILLFLREYDDPVTATVLGKFVAPKDIVNKQTWARFRLLGLCDSGYVLREKVRYLDPKRCGRKPGVFFTITEKGMEALRKWLKPLAER